MYLEHGDECELCLLVLEVVIEQPQSQQFLVHVHEIIVGIEILGYLANLRHDFLGIVRTAIFLFEHQVGIVSEVRTHPVADVAETLEPCVLSFL